MKRDRLAWDVDQVVEGLLHPGECEAGKQFFLPYESCEHGIDHVGKGEKFSLLYAAFLPDINTA